MSGFSGDDMQRLAAARLWATDPRRYPYLAAVVFAMTPVAAPGLGSFAVDRWWRLYIDPEVLRTWSVPSVGAVLVHEAHHLVRDHAGRAEAAGVAPEEQGRWNVAADAEINDDLVADNLPLPGTPVTPALLGLPAHRLAEEYHRRLAAREIRAAPDCGSGADGRTRPWDLPHADATPGIDDDDADLIRVVVAREALASAEQGTAWGSLVRWAKSQAAPQVDWRRVLAGEVRRAVGTTVGAVDYDRSRPARRPPIGGVLLPALRRPEPNVAIVVDTSGSMGRRQLAVALAEIDGILVRGGLGRAGVPVLAVDTNVAAHTRAVTSRDVVLLGGGGTDMRAGIEAAVALRPQPQTVIVITDGATPWPEAAPARVKVIVVLIGDDPIDLAPAWARTVHVSDASLASESEAERARRTPRRWADRRP